MTRDTEQGNQAAQDDQSHRVAVVVVGAACLTVASYLIARLSKRK
ncbi:MAG: hypothetical protein ACK4GC_01995 [Paracoccaceae bacterium]